MLTAILVDDEKAAISSLRQKLLTFCPDVSILHEFTNSVEAVPVIKETKPDILFLDIEMPKMNGFRLLEELKEDTPAIVFTTAYDHFVVQAIRCSAFDYLVKPIDKDDLISAVSRLKEHLSKSTNTRKMDVLLNNLNSLHQQSNKIAIPTLEGVYFFQISDIICLESDGSYTKMYFSNRAALLVTRSLKDFEEMLVGYRFFRVHHSYMINLEHIKQYLKGDGGSVILNNDMQIDVSRRRKEEFLEAINLK